MKILKLVLIVVVAYVGIVVSFESMIGLLQPSPDGTLVITTIDEAGAPHDRVVSRLESNGQLYVAANHWPRAWYARALENPEVGVSLEGEKADYLAVAVLAHEHDRVDRDNPLPLGFRILTGFPPRSFLRLDPR
jgi:hypothetical protein